MKVALVGDFKICENTHNKVIFADDTVISAKTEESYKI